MGLGEKPLGLCSPARGGGAEPNTKAGGRKGTGGESTPGGGDSERPVRAIAPRFIGTCSGLVPTTDGCGTSDGIDADTGRPPTGVEELCTSIGGAAGNGVPIGEFAGRDPLAGIGVLGGLPGVAAGVSSDAFTAPSDMTECISAAVRETLVTTTFCFHILKFLE